MSQLSSANDSLYQATTDMIILAFFFLLRPGEYTDNDNTPFCIKDVQLFIGPRCLNLQTLSAAELATDELFTGQLLNSLQFDLRRHSWT
jgi:hypothetical protein